MPMQFDADVLSASLAIPRHEVLVEDDAADGYFRVRHVTGPSGRFRTRVGILDTNQIDFSISSRRGGYRLSAARSGVNDGVMMLGHRRADQPGYRNALRTDFGQFPGDVDLRDETIERIGTRLARIARTRNMGGAWEAVEQIARSLIEMGREGRRPYVPDHEGETPVPAATGFHDPAEGDDLDEVSGEGEGEPEIAPLPERSVVLSSRWLSVDQIGGRPLPTMPTTLTVNIVRADEGPDDTR